MIRETSHHLIKQGVNKKDLTRYSINTPIVLCVFIALFTVVQFAYYSFVPIDWLVNYKKIVPEFIDNPGKVAFFRSYSDWNTDHNVVRWDDELWCKSANNEYYVHSSATAHGTRHHEDYSEKGLLWLYRAPHPEKESECFLKSNVTVYLPYGIVKHQIAKSDPYRIKALK